MLCMSIIQEEQKQREMEEDTGPSNGSVHRTNLWLHWNKAIYSSLHNDITKQKSEDKCKEWGSCKPLICLFRLINMYSTTGDTEENNAI